MVAEPHASGSAELTGVPLDAIGPERMLFHYHPASGMRAVIVLDTTRFGLTAGGVRLAADLTLMELVRLARAMTYKFAMLELPCGGAKAGIWLDPSDPRRPQVMRALIDVLRQLAASHAYIAGADMGTSAAAPPRRLSGPTRDRVRGRISPGAVYTARRALQRVRHAADLPTRASS
jgi:hypothetical protein